jgi:hypothetical protein
MVGQVPASTAAMSTATGMADVAPLSTAIAAAARHVDSAATNASQTEQGGKRQETSTHGSRFLPVTWVWVEAAQRARRLPHRAARLGQYEQRKNWVGSGQADTPARVPAHVGPILGLIFLIGGRTGKIESFGTPGIGGTTGTRCPAAG